LALKHLPVSFALIASSFVPYTPALAMQKVAAQLTEQGDDFRTGTLANGLRFVVEKTGNPETVVLLAVNAGILDQQKDQGAAAHVIEHIGLGFTNPNDSSAINRLAAQGVIVARNGTTGARWTDYWVKLRRGSTERPEQILGIVSDWLAADSITDASLTLDKANVRSELLGGQTSSLIAQRRAAAQLMGSAIFASQMMDIEGTEYLSLSRVRDFQQKWYRPDLATVVVSGDVDVAKWVAALQILTSIQNPATTNPRSLGRRLPERGPGIVLGKSPRVIKIEREDALPDARIFLTSKFPGPSTLSGTRTRIREDLLAELSVAAAGLSVPGTGPNDIAPDIALGEFGTFIDFDFDQEREAGFKGIRSSVDRAIRGLRQLDKYGVSDADVERARLEVRKHLRGDLGNPLTRARRYKDMSHAARILRLPSISEQIVMLEQIKTAEINRYLRGVINLDRDFDIAMLGSPATLQNATLNAAVISAVRSGKTARIERPAPREILTSIAGPAPAAAQSLVKPGTLVASDLAIFDLPAGQRVLIKRVAGSSNIKISMGSRSDNGAFLSLSKTAFFSIDQNFIVKPRDIKKELLDSFLTDHGISADISIQAGSTIVNFSGDMDSPAPLLQVVRAASMLREKSSEIILTGGGGYLAGADFDRQFGSRPAADVPDQLAQRLRENFSSFSPQVILVSGDFDVDAMVALCARYLSDLPAPTERKKTGIFPSLGTAISGGTDWLQAGKRFRVFTKPTSEPAEALGASRILSEIVRDRLFVLLRNNGRYSPFLAWQAWRDAAGPGVWVVDLRQANDVQADDTLDPLIDREIDQVRRGRFSLEEFNRAKWKLNELAEMASSNATEVNRDAMPYLLQFADYGEAFSGDEAYVRRTTYEQVQRVAARLLKPIRAKAEE
jgi:predicted Zn-dependent peptidase